jgi:LuxR family maltose regulon positive regulatory protein
LGRKAPVASFIYTRLGMLYYEANQLDLARQYVQQGIALSEQFALSSPYTFSLGGLAPILHAQGETEEALSALEKARRLSTQEAIGETSWLLAEEMTIHLQTGDLATVLRWAEREGLSPDDMPQFLHLEQHLAYARLLLSLGRLSDARHWLARLERFARERDLHRWLITVHILQALTAERSGDRSTARELLARALQIAAPQDYTRAFLDEGERVIAMLPDVRHVAPQFVDEIVQDSGFRIRPEAQPEGFQVRPLNPPTWNLRSSSSHSVIAN